MKKYFYSLSILLLFALNVLAKENNVSFIENKHQWETQIKYKADLPFGALFLTNNQFVYSFYKESDLSRIHELKHDFKDVTNEKVNFHSFSVSMLQANKNPIIISNKKKETYHNYFIGNDKSKWAGHVGLYEHVLYENIYDGINLSIYSAENSVKYDFIVQPNASPDIIQLKYDGVKPSINSKGELTYATSVNKITEQAPYAYQLINGKKITVPCKYNLNGSILSYNFPKGYNKNYELIIDPILVFSTYSGSSAMTFGFSATYDNSGSLYAGGECFAVGWPAMAGSFQVTYGGSVDAGINKYSPNGSTLIYSTYFGGSSSDLPNNMVVNSNNELIVCGSTQSSNLPLTVGCFDNTLGGTSDIYIAHFNNTGSALIGSTYIGGSGIDGQNNFNLSPNYGDQNRGEVYVDANQDILCAVSTSSADFPTTLGCYQSTFGGLQDGCIFKLNPTCTNLLYSTYLGGSNYDACYAINYNSLNQIAVVGGTLSTDFPISAGTLHTTNQGGTDGFATILDNTLSNLIASTYLGTSSFDHAYKMQIDNLDNVYVCGQTDGAYPVTAGLYTNPGSGIFIEKLNPTLTASLSSTVIGQTASNLVPTAFLYDVCGNIYFSGFQAQAGLPLSANAYQTTPGGFWLCVLENNMTQLLYATFMGAAGDHVDGGTSRFDPGGIIYHSVCTASSSQYNSAGAWSPTNMAGSWDVASFKFNFETLGLNATINITPNTDSACAPATIPFINNTLNATNYIWDFGDGSPTSNAVSPSHTYTSAGIYTVTLIAYNPNSCALSDTDQVMVHIFEMNSPKVSTKDTAYCDPNAMLQLGATISNLNNNMSYSWQPSSGVLQGQNTLSPLINPATSLSYTITVLDSISALCKKSSQAVVNITFGDTSLFKVYPEDTIVCEGEKVLLMAEGGIKYTWQPATNINDIHAQYIEFKALSPITFSVLIEDTNGCKGTRYANIDLFPKTQVNAGENQIIKYNTGTQLAASGASQYAWNYDVSLSNLTINNPSASPSIATNYIVTGTDVNGCLSKDTVRIDITNLIIPNAFSPNGDLLNDQIKVVTANNLVDFSSLKIYNRWGKLMFSTKDANIGWDGKFNGINCEIGTYYYLLTYSIGNKTYTEKGDISLLR